jgi:hypothetical protein
LGLDKGVIVVACVIANQPTPVNFLNISIVELVKVVELVKIVELVTRHLLSHFTCCYKVSNCSVI